MDSLDSLTIECNTCPATGTTACSDCVVTHLLANDDGPIDLAPAKASADGLVSAADGSMVRDGGGDEEDDSFARAVELFATAGLVDDPPVLVDPDLFEAADPAAAQRRGLVR